MKKRCPQCGYELFFGYGLAGGGVGVYATCDNPECDYFEKDHDGFASGEENGDQEQSG